MDLKKRLMSLKEPRRAMGVLVKGAIAIFAVGIVWALASPVLVSGSMVGTLIASVVSGLLTATVAKPLVSIVVFLTAGIVLELIHESK